MAKLKINLGKKIAKKITPVDPYGADAMKWYQGIVDSQNSGGGGGGYSGGGGGYDAGPAYVAPSLSADPSWLEVGRQTKLGVKQSKADAKRRRALIEADVARQLGDLVPEGEISRENISGSHESRGLFGSGAMERDVARQRAEEARRAAAIRAAGAGQVSEIESQLAARVADLKRAKALARADALSRGYVA